MCPYNLCTTTLGDYKFVTQDNNVLPINLYNCLLFVGWLCIRELKICVLVRITSRYTYMHSMKL